jgi:sugar phosphate permease
MRYRVLAFLCLIAAISYVQRAGLNSAAGAVQRDHDINTEQFGMLGSAWLLGYALMQVPAGWLADRFGSKRTLTVLAVLWSVLTGTIGLCPTCPLLLAQWFVTGMALAGVFPCAAKSIGAWFPDAEKATASGLLGSSTMLGAALASALTSWLLVRQGWSWQAAYALYGAAGVAWALAYAAAVPERGGPQTDPRRMTGADWRCLAASASMWLVCLQQFFRAGAMIFFINWFPKFLTEARELDELQAGLGTSYANLASLVGGVIGGFASDWLLHATGSRRLARQGIAVFGMAVSAALIVATWFTADASAAIALFCVGAFIASFGGISGYTVTIELGGRRVATVFSLMNMSGNLGAALFAYLGGMLRERTGDWAPALFLFVAAFAAAGVCWALLDPDRPIFPEDQT